MNTIVRILKVVVILTSIIVVHEFGHFLAARSCGIPVKQFAIGFGPTLTSTMIGGTEFSLKPILLGGFNEIDAEAMSQASIAAQLWVFAAGSLFGILVTIALSLCTRGGKGLGPIFGLFLMNAFWIVLNLFGPLFMGPAPNGDMSKKSGGMIGPIGMLKGLAAADWNKSLEFSGMINGINLSIIPIVDGGKFVLITLVALGFSPMPVILVLATLTLAALFLPTSLSRK